MNDIAKSDIDVYLTLKLQEYIYLEPSARRKDNSDIKTKKPCRKYYIDSRKRKKQKNKREREREREREPVCV